MTSKISCIKALLAGSNYFVTTPFIYTANKLGDKKTYSIYNYSLIVPVWLGFWNVFCLIAANFLGLSTRTRFLLQGPFTCVISIMISKILKAYKYAHLDTHVQNTTFDAFRKLYVTFSLMFDLFVTEV